MWTSALQIVSYPSNRVNLPVRYRGGWFGPDRPHRLPLGAKLSSTGYLDHNRVLDHNGTVARAGGEVDPPALRRTTRGGAGTGRRHQAAGCAARVLRRGLRRSEAASLAMGHGARRDGPWGVVEGARALGVWRVTRGLRPARLQRV